MSLVRRNTSTPVLRVGWIEGGRLCQELLIEDGRSLKVGKGGMSAGEQRRWFQRKTTEPGREVLKIEQGSYRLLRSPGQAGRVEISGKTVELISENSAWILLPIGSRGKIILPEGSLLFQVLAPQSQSSSVWWRQEEEGVFNGFLGGFGLAAMSFVTWMQTLPAIEQELSPDDIVGYVDVASIPKIELPKLETKVITPQKPDRPSPQGPRADRPSPGESTTPARPQDIVAGINLGGLLNEGPESFIPSDFPVIVPIGEGGNQPGLRRGRAVDPDAPPVDIQLPTLRGPGIQQREVAVKIPVRVEPEEEEEKVIREDLGTDGTKVLAVIQKYSSGVESCTAQALNEDPRLKARLSATWEIQEGRVMGARLSGGGSPALQSCVLGVVRRMKFESSISADSVNYTWIVSGM